MSDTSLPATTPVPDLGPDLRPAPGPDPRPDPALARLRAALPADLPAAVRAAAAADAASARELRDDLLWQGRAGHPALPTLETIAAADRAADGAADEAGAALDTDAAEWADLLAIAAIAFECGVRVALGAELAAAGPDGGIPDRLARVLVTRDPMPWEPDIALSVPYREVDWRTAVARAGEDLAAGRFAMPPRVPGGALVAALAEASGDPAALAAALLGVAPRNEVLDPVVAAGGFLAQALPGFTDVDMVLREAREAEIAARGAA